ncbi:MAG TPA: ABC transporter permease subunit [Thermoplasmata archaeon]|nr:ABC transporter permease subunit [Thermoplasmata archaeon]
MVQIRKLFLNDIRNIVRDRLLLYSAFLIPLIIIIFTRLVVPWISENVSPIEQYYPLLFMFIVITIPLMFGFVLGFLIMDERDENLLTVLRVMPISRNTYLLYRMILLSVLSLIYILLFPILTGLIDIGFIDYLPVALLLTFLTPTLGLIANIVATNKVQAFAVFKTLGGVFYIPLFAFFINNDLKYILGIIPNFWTFMALDKLLTTGNQEYVYLGIGFCLHIVLFGVLFYLFNKKN